MNEAWAHKWMNNSKTSIMFSNKHVSTNIIYSIEDLHSAIENHNPFRTVPLAIIEKVLRETKPLSLKLSFKGAIAA